VVVFGSPHANGWLRGLQTTRSSLPRLRNPTQTRVIPLGTTQRIGDGYDEVSAAEVRKKTRRGGPSVAEVDGQARLGAEVGTVVADQVHVSMTIDPAHRPAGMKSDYFGAMRMIPGEGEDS
jgi:hypothetical protein